MSLPFSVSGSSTGSPLLRESGLDTSYLDVLFQEEMKDACEENDKDNMLFAYNQLSSSFKENKKIIRQFFSITIKKDAAETFFFLLELFLNLTEEDFDCFYEQMKKLNANKIRTQFVSSKYLQSVSKKTCNQLQQKIFDLDKAVHIGDLEKTKELLEKSVYPPEVLWPHLTTAVVESNVNLLSLLTEHLSSRQQPLEGIENELRTFLEDFKTEIEVDIYNQMKLIIINLTRKLPQDPQPLTLDHVMCEKKPL